MSAAVAVAEAVHREVFLFVKAEVAAAVALLTLALSLPRSSELPPRLSWAQGVWAATVE